MDYLDQEEKEPFRGLEALLGRGSRVERSTCYQDQMIQVAWICETSAG